MSDRDEIDRLVARLDRERRARREAELIAERGLREHWRLTSELETRVAERTADLEREIAGQAVLNEFIVELVRSIGRSEDATGAAGPADNPVVERFGWIEILLELPSAPGRTSSATPTDISERLSRRWQLVLAKSGHLLSIAVDSSTPAVTARWDGVLVVLDLVLASTHRWAQPGGVTIGLDIEAASIGDSARTLVVSVRRPPGRVVSGRSPVLEAAATVIARSGGTLAVERSPDSLTLELRAPVDDAQLR